MSDTAKNTDSDQYTLFVNRIREPIAFDKAFEQQVSCRDAVAHGDGPQTLMLLEHAPTFSLGRNADEAHLLRSRPDIAAAGIDIVAADRGGDITYHGPGQLVAYPILDLRNYEQSVNWYLRTLEEVILDVLAHYGLTGERLKGYTGVWVNGGKVAAIGVALRDWVTYHGISINVAPNMEHWRMIVPCGIPDKPVTSLAELLGSAPPMDEVCEIFVECFRNRFELR